MTPALRARLLELAADPRTVDQIGNDPVRFVHRYPDPADQEIAGFFASALAFGRVSLFAPVIAAVLDRADALGGPSTWARTLDADAEHAALDGLYYRWTRASDLVVLAAALGDVQRSHGSLGALVRVGPDEPDVVPALSRLVLAVREAVVRHTGVPFDSAPRGLRYLLVDPAEGSSAKRVHLYARWMVRSDAVDRGVWSHVPPRSLLVPVDTHVHRIARLVGLTDRKAADLRTSREVTARLRALDAEDPVRFDFALAHVGISGGCRGQHVPAVCDACALQSLCSEGSAG
ncbi:MAG: TIGR02757 family protein [Myxococcales bacterium]|nr:TIGR02757 family protein [Myxococcales bacterium]MCB9667841.1 TIGR02757 family protein [Alphaproteobacteria bacterium]MCB9690495.1 TIGR02757 family protein [Alphaproteobacteria bacterium]